MQKVGPSVAEARLVTDEIFAPCRRDRAAVLITHWHSPTRRVARSKRVSERESDTVRIERGFSDRAERRRFTNAVSARIP